MQHKLNEQILRTFRERNHLIDLDKDMEIILKIYYSLKVFENNS
jgi:low affinity Fe/Cu permease